jgi:GLPGLI family protein
MKKVLLLLVLFCCGAIGWAQPAQQVTAIAYYDFAHVRDTANPNSIYREEMMLWMNSDASCYKSFTRIASDSLRKAALLDVVKAGSGTIDMGKYRPFSQDEYFWFPDQKSLFQHRQLLQSHYLMKDPQPEINWAIAEETKKIGDYNCQKATARFRGREYTAWFCVDLPYRFGPWKLQGLPGLILEAYDAKGEVKFMFNRFVNSDIKKFTMIELPPDGIQTTEKEFLKTLEAIRSNPNAGASSMGLSVTMQSGQQVRKTNKINNPIELEPAQ